MSTKYGAVKDDDAAAEEGTVTTGFQLGSMSLNTDVILGDANSTSGKLLRSNTAREKEMQKVSS